MKAHELKIKPIYFRDVISGVKKFECRMNDRDYQVGDLVDLKEFEGGKYTGRVYSVEITYILHGAQYGLGHGACIFNW